MRQQADRGRAAAKPPTYELHLHQMQNANRTQINADTRANVYRYALQRGDAGGCSGAPSPAALPPSLPHLRLLWLPLPPGLPPQSLGTTPAPPLFPWWMVAGCSASSCQKLRSMSSFAPLCFSASCGHQEWPDEISTWSFRTPSAMRLSETTQVRCVTWCLLPCGTPATVCSFAVSQQSPAKCQQPSLDFVPLYRT